MSDYLTRLSERALGVSSVLRPVVAPIFAPDGGRLTPWAWFEESSEPTLGVEGEEKIPRVRILGPMDQSRDASNQITSRPAGESVQGSSETVRHSEPPNPTRVASDDGSIEASQDNSENNLEWNEHHSRVIAVCEIDADLQPVGTSAKYQNLPNLMPAELFRKRQERVGPADLTKASPPDSLPDAQLDSGVFREIGPSTVDRRRTFESNLIPTNKPMDRVGIREGRTESDVAPRAVQISIGRIELRAVHAPLPPAPSRKEFARPESRLAEYLARKRESRS